MKASTRGRLQEARLGLCAVAVAAALGCADPLVTRLVEPAAPPPPAASETATWIRYVVQPGDTLGDIAACRRTSLSELAGANQISAPDRLRAGSVLRVPPGNGCAARRPVARNAPASPRAKAEALLASAISAYDGADFEQARLLARAAIEAIAPHPSDGGADALRARCHVVAGMAAAGLEQREHAIVEFRHALDLAPDLALDPDRSSPRVLELVELARERPAGSGHFVETSTR